MCSYALIDLRILAVTKIPESSSSCLTSHIDPPFLSTRIPIKLDLSCTYWQACSESDSYSVYNATIWVPIMNNNNLLLLLMSPFYGRKPVSVDPKCDSLTNQARYTQGNICESLSNMYPSPHTFRGSLVEEHLSRLNRIIVLEGFSQREPKNVT
jgi:hypothetical protein